MEDFIRNTHNFDKEAQFFDENDETTHQLASLMNLDPNSQVKRRIDKTDIKKFTIHD